MSGQSIVISVLADTKNMSKGFEDAGKKASGLSSAFKVAAIGIGAAVVVVGGFVAASIKAAADAEMVAAQTTAAIASTGSAAGKTAEQIGELSTKLSRMSGIDDEVIQSGANIMLTFTKIQGVNFDKATASALDMSVALGTDMKSASILVGKALNDPIKGITALSRSGVQFTEQQKAQITAMTNAGDAAGAQSLILAELQTQFGGSAEAAGKTLNGALGKLKTSFGNIQEAIGGAFLPVLTLVADKAAAFMQMLEDSAGFQNFIAGFTTFASGLLDGTAKLPDIGTFITDGVQKAAAWLSGGGLTAIVDSIAQTRSSMLDAGLKLFPVLVDAVVQSLPAILDALLQMTTDFINLIVGAVPDILAAGIVLFQSLIDAVVTILPPLLDKLVDLLPDIIKSIIGMIPQLITAAITLFKALVAAIPVIVPILVAALVNLIPQLVTTIVEMIPQILDAAIELFTALAESIPVIIPVLLQAIIDLLPVLVTAVIDLVPKLLSAGIELFTSLITAIPKIIPDLIEAVIKLLPELIGTLLGMVPDLLKAGVQLIGGLVSGLWKAASSVGEALLNIIGSAVQGFKDFLGIKSPSRLFKGFGSNVIKGLEFGLSASNNIGGIMSGLSDQVSNGFSAELAVPGGYRASAFGGNTYAITVQAIAPNAEVGRAVVAAINDYERIGGSR